MRGRLSLGILGCVLLYAAFAMIGLHLVGIDHGLYYDMQMRYTTLDEIGLSDAELKEADRALSACIRGDLSGLENWFNAKEIYHMGDVARLFQMLRVGIAVTLSGAGLLIGLSRGRRFAKASAAGFALWAGLLAALALLIASDFSAAFTAFHEILFTNDLWLLDPRTDLLIRMCPEEMFSAMALRIGLIGLGGAAAVPLTASIAAYGRKKLDLRRVREDAR